MLALIISLASCKRIEYITDTVIETRTDTITQVEIVKTEPLVDTIILKEYIDRDRPVYYKDRNWEAKFSYKNDSLTAEIIHLTDSIEHINRTTKINNFRSETKAARPIEKKKGANWTLIIIVLGSVLIGGLLVYFKF